jgi:hypothetical protein
VGAVGTGRAEDLGAGVAGVCGGRRVVATFEKRGYIMAVKGFCEGAPCCGLGPSPTADEWVNPIVHSQRTGDIDLAAGLVRPIPQHPHEPHFSLTHQSGRLERCGAKICRCLSFFA